jgi:hypothetical protein
VCLPAFAAEAPSADKPSAGSTAVSRSPDGALDLKAGVPELTLTPVTAHTEVQAETVVTASLGRVMSFGLYRGFMNVILSPVELARGTSFEFSIRKWYFAFATMIPAGLGGTLSRIAAGMADISTLGFYGDTPLAEGYPDFVWQQDWTYDPAAPRLSTIISTNIVPVSIPEIDISTDDLSRRQKTKPSNAKITPPSKE